VTAVSRRVERPTTPAYVPALDGLRAVAVVAVIAYHLDFGWAQGGYLGVDLFFVLSGYLITSLLLGEWVVSGGIGFRSFWARRARRLLPAVILLLLVLALYAGLRGPGLDRSALRPDALATLFYSANWHQVFAHQSYFAQFASASPLRHTWSLAIEEQFYLIWPLILLGLLVAARGRRVVLLVATGLLAAGSAALMAVLYHPGIDPTRVYYGTDSRAFELAIGAALAVALASRGPLHRRSGRGVLQGAGVVAMGLLVYGFVGVGGPPGWLYQGGLFGACVLVGIVVASVVQPRPGPLGAVLSLSPLRFLGIISYGLYLWHWPVLVLATEATTGISGYPLKALQVGLTLTLATASYYLVERPVRRASFSGFSGWKRRSVAPVGVAATAGALVFATVSAANPASSLAVGSDAKSGSGLPAAVAGAAPDPAATPTAAAAPDLSSAMVVGDSTAITLAEPLKGPGVSAGLAIHDGGRFACTIIMGYSGDNASGSSKADFPYSPSCDWRTKWPPQLDQWRPKVVLMLFGPLDTADHLLNGRWLRVGTPEWQSYYQDQLAAMVKLLSSQGAQVVIATVPQYHHTPDAAYPDPTYNDPRRLAALNGMYEYFASTHSVNILDLASQVQPSDLGEDGVHFSLAGVTRLAAFVDSALDELANPVPSVVPPPGLKLASAGPTQSGPGAR
jgi:peptidoglycan/LPS O-acetylase OafA/YrhL/lysophospholipase L1-like esterase